MFNNILKKLFLTFIGFYNDFFKIFEFQMYKVYMTYTYDGKTHDKLITKFWFNEKKYWLKNGNSEEHFCDVTKKYKKQLELFSPKGVDNIVYSIKYYFNNKKYTCITKDPCISLPNKKSSGATFRLPLTSVELLDSDKNPVINITKKYLKVIGPYNDFHNAEDIFIKDLFYFDNYEYIKTTNIIKQEKTIDKNSSPHLLL
jgi:hypothetical protein